MIYVSFGGKSSSIMNNTKDALGGSSFGSGTYAYSGSEPRPLHELELKVIFLVQFN
jgi:hypothetical protein